MATYNGERYLEQQIISIVKQTFGHWHLYVRDDGSQDNTHKIIKQMVKKYPSQITDLTLIPGGGSSLKNFFTILEWVTRNASYDFIMLSDQDDYWLDNKICKTIEKFKDNSIPTLVYTDLKVVDSRLKTVRDSYMKFYGLDPYKCTLEKLLVQNKVTGCTMMWNKKLNSLIKYKENSNIAMHDWWIALIAAAFGQIIYINEGTVLYRQHSHNVVGAKKRTILNHLNHTRESINRSEKQAKAFYDVYNYLLSGANLRTVKAYSSMKEFGKIKRIYLLFKFDLIRDQPVQLIGQVIYI